MKKYLIAVVAILSIDSALFTQEYRANETYLTQEIRMQNDKIVEKPTIMIIGIECRTSNSSEAAPYDIPKLWEQFYKEDIINQVPNKISSEIIALYCDYESDYRGLYSLVIGCPVGSLDDIPEGMVAKTIPGGSYAVFSAIGDHPKSLIETWGNIWNHSNLDRTYTGDYELYGDKFFSLPQEVEVYIAIKDSESGKK